MGKIDLAALKAQVRYRSVGTVTLEPAFICPHGDSGTGKSILWGMMGYGNKGSALFVQGEKGDRDLPNPDIGIIDINTMYNIGSTEHLQMDPEGNLIGDINNIDDMAHGWEMVLAITEDCFRSGGRNINPASTMLKHIIWDSGTTFQAMCLAWVIKTTPTRNRVIGAGGQPRASLEDFGDVVGHFENWMMNLRDLKAARNMNVIVPFLSQDYSWQEIGPDGYSVVTVSKKMPMVIGKKLPAKIVSFADFAPYHHMVEGQVQTPDPTNPGKMIFQTQLIRGLRWQPSPKIYAKGRGNLPAAHPIRTTESLRFPDQPYDEVNNPMMGYECHLYNIRKICEMGNIPFDVKADSPKVVVAS